MTARVRKNGRRMYGEHVWMTASCMLVNHLSHVGMLGMDLDWSGIEEHSRACTSLHVKYKCCGFAKTCVHCGAIVKLDRQDRQWRYKSVLKPSRRRWSNSFEVPMVGEPHRSWMLVVE